MRSVILRRFSVSYVSVLLFAACAGQDASPDSASIAVAVVMERVPTAADSAAVRVAEQVFRNFLEASREGYAGPAVRWDSLFGCNPSTQPAFPITLLAKSTVLPSGMRADTVVVRAAVMSVAEQEPDDRRANRFVASQRVRTDTLEWDVVKDPLQDRWVVCNGIRFGFVGPDSLTTWLGERASFAAARALAAMLYKDSR